MSGDQTNSPSFFKYKAALFAAAYDMENGIEDSMWLKNLEAIHLDGAHPTVRAAEQRFWTHLAEGVDRKKVIYAALHEPEGTRAYFRHIPSLRVPRSKVPQVFSDNSKVSDDSETASVGLEREKETY